MSKSVSAWLAETLEAEIAQVRRDIRDSKRLVAEYKGRHRTCDPKYAAARWDLEARRQKRELEREEARLRFLTRVKRELAG